MALKIVLIEPKIPQNTGNVARLAAATQSELHLVGPLGFSLEDKYLKRAGLDYWPYVQLTVHENWTEFAAASSIREDQLWLFSTHATRPYYGVDFAADDYLIFGNEVAGLPQSFHEEFSERRLQIPMKTPEVRSLNLATAAGIVVYEALRQRAVGEL